MKKQLAVFAAITVMGCSFGYAQPQTDEAGSIPEQPAEQTDEGIIEEPSGAGPGLGAQPEVPAPSPEPPDVVFPPQAGVGAEKAGSATTNLTITISQTFTNAANAITVVGEVDSADQKQAVEQALQQAVPGKEINNHLRVASEEITEPSGAERPEDAQQEQQLDEELPQDTDVEREFELQGESDLQTQP